MSKKPKKPFDEVTDIIRQAQQEFEEFIDNWARLDDLNAPNIVGVEIVFDPVYSNLVRRVEPCVPILELVSSYMVNQTTSTIAKKLLPLLEKWGIQGIRITEDDPTYYI
jgi:hypothetical protein